MTTPAPKMTPLTDPNNVSWVVEVPPPAQVTASVRPRMSAYSSLIAAIRGRYDEDKHKRDSKGRFAKKAGVKATPPPPTAKKSAKKIAPSGAAGIAAAKRKVRDSERVKNAYEATLDCADSYACDKAFTRYTDVQKKFNDKYGVSWSPNYHNKLELDLEDLETGTPPVSTAAPTPGMAAKKTAAPPAPPAPAPSAAASPGKKMTNKVIYGKHANGTIIETSDGQSRMIFNAAGNNWTFQERTPDGGWKTTEILGKGAAYKKANTLSTEWGEPHDGTPDELTPVPGVDPGTPNSFAPGWDDTSGISSFQQKSILTSFKLKNSNPNGSPAIIAMNTANIAQSFGLEPEQVIALIDADRGDTAFSDAMKKYLDGKPFPPPTYPSPAKKAAAAKKITAAKKTAAAVAPTITPTVAPSPSPSPAAAPAASPGAGKKFTVTTQPMALATLGLPYELSDLQEQADESANISKLRAAAQAAAVPSSGVSFDEVNKLTQKYIAAKKAYSEKYGAVWSPNHATALSDLYKEVTTPDPTSLAPGTSIPGTAYAGVTVGAKVATIQGAVGTAVGPGTTSYGTPGVQIKLTDGTMIVVGGNNVKPMTPKQQKDFDTAPANGTKVTHPLLGEVTIIGNPMTNATNDIILPVMNSAGTTTKVLASSLVPPAPSPYGHSTGMTVDSPGGPGTITGISPSGNTVVVEFPDGSQGMYDASDIAEIPPSLVPTAAPTPAAAAGLHAIGTQVSVPHGVGTIVGHTPSGDYVIKLGDGSQVHAFADDVSEITPTAPVPAPPSPPTLSSSVTYDANGVPVLPLSTSFQVEAAFQAAGVNWYNSSEALFNAAYDASQATGLSIDDVLKYADANFHKSKTNGGKPIQTKVAKWAKSSKGKAHIKAKLSSSTVPVTAPTPPSVSPPTPAPSAPGASLPGTVTPVTGIPKLKQMQAFTQFTAGMVALSDTPQSLAQKASDVGKNLGLTPEQVLAIVDAKKAEAAGVTNGNLFSNKVLTHLNGKAFPAPATPASYSAGLAPSATAAKTKKLQFAVPDGYAVISTTNATQMQANMVAATTPVTASQTKSLRHYTSGAYNPINKCLRFNIGCTPSMKNHIKEATAGMRPSTENITTFRGTGYAAFSVSNYAELEAMVGGYATEPGFSSTSIDPNRSFSGSVIMQIDIPAGTPGSYVANISHYPNEREFLLPPGTRFRILEVKPGPGGNAYVHVEVVPA